MYLVKSALFVFLLLSASAIAHEFPCGHNHIESESGKVFLENTCNGDPAACDPECFQVTTRHNNTYCTCGHGDCETAFAGTFIADMSGPIVPNTTRVFSIETQTVEVLSVLVEQIEVASFGPTEEDTFGPMDIEALFGTTTLAFGSFEDPEAIPVTVLQFDIDLISLAGDGKQSGENTVELRDRIPVEMLYNSTTNRFSLANTKEIAIKLALENDLAGNQPAVLYFDGKLDALGNLAVFGQIAVGIVSTAIEEPSWGQVKSDETARQSDVK
jgi:hypothetical protein